MNLHREYERVVWSVSAIVLGICGLVLLGWAFDIAPLRSLRAGWQPMKVGTAFSLAACATALLLAREGRSPFNRGISRVFAALAASAGTLSMAAQISTFVSGYEPAWIVSTVFREFLASPGRMAPLTAVTLTGFGAALLCLTCLGARGAELAHAITLPCALLHYLVLISYLVDVTHLHTWMGAAVALPTCVACLALSAGILYARSDTWFMRVLTSPEPGSGMARRLMPVVLTIPAFFGWLWFAAERSQLVTFAGGMAMAVLTSGSVLLWVVWLTARSVNRTDRERRQTDEALRESEERYRSLVEMSPDAIFVNRDDRIVQVNRAALELFHADDPSQILGRPVYDFFEAEDHPLTRERFGQLRAGATVPPVEKKIVRLDGSSCDVEVAASPFRERGGLAIQVILRDITKRKQAEGALRQQREWLRVTLTSIGDAVVATDTSGAVTFLNEAATQLTGWTGERAFGQPVETVLRIRTGASPEAGRELVGRVLREGRTLSLAAGSALLAGDGREIPVEDCAAPIRDHAGNVTGVVLIIHDVAEKQRAHAALEASEQSVRQKLESILSPEGDIGSLKLSEVIQLPAVQSLVEDFYKLTGIPVTIVDRNGERVVNSGTQDACSRFYRMHPASRANCDESQEAFCTKVPAGEFRLGKCKNQMWKVATPLLVGEMVVGHLLCEQFFFDDEPLNQDLFRSQAETYGFDSEQFLAALSAAPRVSRSSLETGISFLVKLGQTISQLSYSNLKLARSLAQLDAVTDALRQHSDQLAKAEEIAHVGSWVLDVPSSRLTWSDEVYRIFGLEPQEFGATYAAFLEAVHPEDRDAVDAAYSGSVREGSPSYEITHRVVQRHSGEIRWVHEKCEHTRGPAGTIVRSVGMVQDITERKQAEAALAESERRWKDLAESMPQLVWTCTPEGWCDYLSRQWCDYIGIPERDSLGYRWMDAVHPADRPDLMEQWRRAIAGSGLLDFEFRLRRHDGAWRWFKSRAVSVTDSNGKVIKWYGCNTDIEDLKQTERALQESEERLRFATSAAGISVWSWTPGTSRMVVSANWRQLFGAAADAEVGFDTWCGALHPEDRDRVVGELQDAARRHTGFHSEYRVLRPDGTVRWIVDSGRCSQGDSGHAVEMAGVNVDITERKRAEDAARQWQGAFEQADLGIALTNAASETFQAVNEAFAAQRGYTREELVGCPVEVVYPPGEKERVAAALRAAEAGSGHAVFESVHQRKDGSRFPVLMDVTAVEDESGRFVSRVAYVLDLTERKHVEQQLLHAQKLESIGVLAGGIAHDFNNLLAGVIGNASLLEDWLPPEGPAADILYQIVKSGEQAAHLTRQLLAYAGKGRFVLERVNLSALARDTRDLIQSSLSKKIELRFDLARDLLAVESDPGQMQQILMNLALNAAEAIGDNPGVISIRTGMTLVDAATCRGNPEDASIEPGLYVQLEVSDTGCGMDEPTRAKIFDPFFTTKFQGRGLGLAAVAGIVRSQKGTIRVRSTPGAGSTFRVLLPAKASAIPAPASSPAVRDEDLRGDGTVMVVDDEPLIRELASRSLEKQGYEVLLADSGTAAIDLLRSRRSPIRAVVLDLSMPGMSGQDVLPHLREIDPDLPVILSSGYSRAEAFRLFGGGAAVSGFLQKPYTVRELAREIKSVAARKGQLISRELSH